MRLPVGTLSFALLLSALVAVESHADRDRMGCFRSDFQASPEAAALPTGAARIHDELLGKEQQGLLVLGHLHRDEVALVAWQAMDGLLADDHRHHLQQLTQRLRLVVMVPRAWARLLEQ